MAEIFGAVASGIGIAGVAAQAFDGIRKLRTFCNDVRDAPEEIEYMINELEILLSTIAAIEAQIQRNTSVCPNLDPTPALRFVEQSVRSLNAVIEKLNIEITHKRKLGSIKMAWKKKVLETYMVKIERSKTSLGLAVSAYLAELHLQTTLRIETRMSQISMNIAKFIPPCQERLILPGSTPSIRSDVQLIGRDRHPLVDDHDKGYRKVQRKPKSSRVISVFSCFLILPQWLAHYSLQIDVCKVAQNWNLNLKPYRTMPQIRELPGVMLCGHFHVLRHLIDSRQLTVFDRDTNGNTLLHYLAACASLSKLEGALDMAQFLIERGVDVNERDCRGTLAIYGLIDCSIDFVTSDSFWNVDLLQLLVDESHLDAELFWEGLDHNLMMVPSPGFERQLKRMFPLKTMEYPRITLIQRLKCVALPRYQCISPRDLAVYLDVESLEAVYPRLRDNLKRDLLRVALTQWAFAAGKVALIEEWEETLRALFATGAQLEILCSQEREDDSRISALGDPGDEPVVELILRFLEPYVHASEQSGVRHSEFQGALRAFRYLISRSEILGINLATRSSRKTFKIRFDMFVNDENSIRSSDSSFEDYPGRVPLTLSLCYDDKKSTWMIWDLEGDDYCGQFWDLVERPERTMPGTWVD